MNVTFASSGWQSLVVHVVGTTKRWRLSEWNATADERPQSIEVEAFGIVGFVAAEQHSRPGQTTYGPAVPVHENARAALADVREAPTGAIRVRGYGVYPNRGAMTKAILAATQHAWDAAHPIADAPGSTTDTDPQS